MALSARLPPYQRPVARICRRALSCAHTGAQGFAARLSRVSPRACKLDPMTDDQTLTLERVQELGRLRDAWANTLAYYVVRGEMPPAELVHRYAVADRAYLLAAAELGIVAPLAPGIAPGSSL